MFDIYGFYFILVHLKLRKQPYNDFLYLVLGYSELISFVSNFQLGEQISGIVDGLHSSLYPHH
jgi:hypothetical protein